MRILPFLKSYIETLYIIYKRVNPPLYDISINYSDEVFFRDFIAFFTMLSLQLTKLQKQHEKAETGQS